MIGAASEPPADVLTVEEVDQPNGRFQPMRRARIAEELNMRKQWKRVGRWRSGAGVRRVASPTLPHSNKVTVAVPFKPKLTLPSTVNELIDYDNNVNS
jgi:hypothetical protein